METPSFPKMLIRGITRRCPWCGGRGAFFTQWLRKSPSCLTCGIKWRRDDVGFELGAGAIAAIIVLGPLMLLLGAIVAVNWPEVPVAQMFIVLGIGGLILPVVLHPVTYTIWQAIDLKMRPVEPDNFETSHLEEMRFRRCHD